MRFLMVRPEQLVGDCITLEPDQQHYLLRVLRRAPGDQVACVVTEAALSVDGVLEEASKKVVRVRVRSRTALPPPAQPALALAIGILKAAKLETVIREATELGIARLIPLASSRAVPEWHDDQKRLARLEQLALGACQQSGNPYPVVVEKPIALDALISREQAAGRGLVMAVAASGPHLADLMLEPGREQVLLVGPEGDFTPEEMTGMRNAGGKIVTLHGHVLRSETACLVLSTLMLDRMGRWG